MRDCFNCGKPVDGDRCPACGYGDKVAGKEGDPDWWRCANVWKGQRCAHSGSIAHGTLGGGPWYCAQHAFPSYGRKEPMTERAAIAITEIIDKHGLRRVA